MAYKVNPLELERAQYIDDQVVISYIWESLRELKVSRRNDLLWHKSASSRPFQFLYLWVGYKTYNKTLGRERIQ